MRPTDQDLVRASKLGVDANNFPSLFYRGTDPCERYIQDIHLRQFRHCCEMELDERIAQRANFSTFSRREKGMLVKRMTADFLGEPPKEICAGEAPADWWQALKERFAPKWFLERWPVERYKFFVTAQVLYPLLEPQVPGEVVVYRVAKSPEVRYG